LKLASYHPSGVQNFKVVPRIWYIVLSIGTGCGLDSPGIKSPGVRGEVFRTLSDRPWGPPSLL